MLRPTLAHYPVSGFQHWPPWRPLVVATATELARYTGQHLITPQTILTRRYRAEIFAGLRAAQLTLFLVSSTRMTTHYATGSKSPTRPGSGG